MKHLLVAAGLFVLAAASPAYADKYTDATNTFMHSGASAGFFRTAYAYAVFPTVGEGGFIVGAAVGKGRVYVHRRLVGDTTMTQGSVGFQAGGKAYSQIIFFEDKRALDEFESGNFEFGADASVVAITAGANAGAATNGASAGVSVGQNDAATRGVYQKGMAVFTVAKGGLMFSASIAGQKFSYTPRSAN